VIVTVLLAIYLPSLPSRERGLKPLYKRPMPTGSVSLPSRERGLKQLETTRLPRLKHVAPFTGAWIETGDLIYSMAVLDDVAPFTGAWIETIQYLMSLPQYSGVAPFTGAWIETIRAWLTRIMIRCRSLHGSVD